MWKKVLLSFFCIALPLQSLAAELTLQDAIFLALRYNPDVKNAEIERVIDKFNLRLAKNSFELQYALTGSSNYTAATANGVHSTQNNYSLMPSTSYNTTFGSNLAVNLNNAISQADGSSGAHYNPALTVTATQHLLRGFGSDVTLSPLYNAYDTERINKLKFKATVISTITQVISSYTSVVQTENSLLAEQLALNASQTNVDQFQELIKAGKRAPADIIQFQADVASQRLSVENLKNSLDQAKLNLIQLLGLDPSSQFTVTKSVEFPFRRLPTLQEATEIALKNNIGYQQQLLNYRILQRDLVVARDQQRWQLDLTATATSGGGSGGGSNAGIGSLGNGRNKSGSVGLQLSVPIHDLSLQQTFVQNKVSVEQAKISVDAAKRQVETDVHNNYDNVLSQQLQIQQAQQALQLDSDNLRIANLKLQYGKITPFEVSSLQTTLTTAQLNLIAAQTAYDNALASFDQVLGVSLDRWDVKVRY